MIEDIRTGRGVNGALLYASGKDGAFRLNCGTMAGDTVEELTAEAGQIRQLRRNLGKACFHASLSIHPDEHLTDDQWGDVATEYMEQMGFQDAPWVAYRHTDTDHEHIHIVAVRIDARTGRTISDSKNYQRGAKIIQALEAKYGLRPAAQAPGDAWERAPKRGEIRTGKSDRLTLKELISATAVDGPTFTELVNALDQVGVRVCVNASKEGRIGGLSYSMDGSKWMKGSSIGKAFSWRGLLNQGVTYVPDRDVEALKRTASIRALEQFTSNTKARPDRSADPDPADKSRLGENPKDAGRATERDPRQPRPAEVDGLGGARVARPQPGTSPGVVGQIRVEVDPGGRKQAFKAKLLADFYKREISPEVKPHIVFVDLALDCPKIWLPGNVWVEDRGDCIQGSSSDRLAVKMMLDMAEAKGWGKIAVSGSNAFIEMVLEEATSRGIPVAGYEDKQFSNDFGPR